MSLQRPFFIENIYPRDLLNFLRRHLFAYPEDTNIIETFQTEVSDSIIAQSRLPLYYVNGKFVWNEKGTSIPWSSSGFEMPVVCYIPLDRQMWQFWWKEAEEANSIEAPFGSAILYPGGIRKHRPAPSGCHSYIELGYDYV